MSYQYWIIRFVPNVVRGEFSNIGIVCGRDGGDWAVEFDLRSIRNLGNFESGLGELSRWRMWFTRALEARSGASPNSRQATSTWVEHLRARQANSVQFSSPSPIGVNTAREGVDLLFPHLVERTQVRRRQGLDRRNLRAEVRAVLEYESDFVLGRDLFAGPRFQIGKQSGEFDFLRFEDANKALTNVWAFNIATLDVLERDIQSWNYLIGRLRNDGASLTFRGKSKNSSTVTVDSESPIEVVYDPPSTEKTGRRIGIFEAALEAWELNNVTCRTLNDFRHAAHIA